MNNFIHRNILKTGIEIPEYYLSVTYRDLSLRKARWERERKQERIRPTIKESDSLNNKKI